MGLTTTINDVSDGSIPVLLLVVAAGCVSYLRSLLHHLLHSFVPHSNEQSLNSINSQLGIILFADGFSTYPPLSFAGAGEQDCVVCLCRIRAGESVRKLPCCHVFHKECLDGWFGQMKLSCPLCRSPLVEDVCRSDA